jgi:hypothetical protein
LVILLSYARNTWVLSKNVSYVLTIWSQSSPK